MSKEKEEEYFSKFYNLWTLARRHVTTELTGSFIQNMLLIELIDVLKQQPSRQRKIKDGIVEAMSEHYKS